MTRPGHEWDAASYHKVSAPQTGWGRTVLARLELAGDERVLDAGCGSGKLTAALLDRLPRGRVVALDRSWNMLQVAATNLRPAYGARIGFVRAALPALPFHAAFDVVFSTATFHWVLDHAALFANVFTALHPGGRLHAQCGGGPNLARARALAGDVMAEPDLAPYFAGWPSVWEYASAEDTAARLAAAGFVDVHADLEAAPTTMASEEDYRAFVTTVIFHPHLARLPAHLRGRFLDGVTARAAAEPEPFLLDYWRLNMTARKPVQ